MTDNRARVLVTGGAGFIGGRVVRRFEAEGCRVLVLDPKGGRDGQPVAGDLIALDAASPRAVRAVRLFSPHLVVHAAAQTRVGSSLGDPVGDARTNILGTVRMLEAAQAASSRGFVFLSSAAIYGEPLQLPIMENHPTRPQSPYGLSKLAATRYVDYYRAAGLLPTLSLIPANVYGPGQPAGDDGAVVPAFMRAAAAGQPLPLEGDGAQTRDFVYIDDLVEAVWLSWRWLQEAGGGLEEEVAATGDTGVSDLGVAFTGRLNLGTGLETTIAHLADLVERAGGRPLGRIPRPPQVGAIRRSSLNPVLARRVLGWSPVVALAHGVERTYRAWRGS